MFWGRKYVWTCLLDLKDTHGAFWWKTLNVVVYRKTPRGTFKWAPPAKDAFWMWCRVIVLNLKMSWRYKHAGEQGTGTPFGLPLWFEQNSILDTTPLYNVASLPVYQSFTWWGTGGTMGNKLCKHRNTQRLEHKDSKFKHAGSRGKIRNRNKMPCNDVLMEFWQIT